MRLILAIAVMLCGSGGRALADSWNLGVSTVSLTRDYVKTTVNAAAPLVVEEQQSDEYTLATLQLTYNMKKKLVAGLGATFTAGVGFPMGSASFENSSAFANNSGAALDQDSVDAGDTEDVSVMTIPVLVGLDYGIPIGRTELSFGIAAGAIVVGAKYEMVDTSWSGVPPAAQAQDDVRTYTSVTAVPVGAVLFNIGFKIRLGESSAIGVRIPLGFMSENGLNHSKEEEKAAVAVGMQASKETGWQAGGFTGGFEIAWITSL